MKISPISQQQNIAKKTSFKMSLHVPKSTKNLIDQHVAKRVIDPIEWLATARALEHDSAHYEIIARPKTSLWETLTTPDIFIITKHAEDEEVKALEARPENLLSQIQSLDSLIRNAVQLQKQEIDTKIAVTTSAITGGKVEVKQLASKVKPVQELENKINGEA